MEKIIEISGKECRFISNAATPRRYRIKFGRDLFGDFQIIAKATKKNKDNLPTEALEIIENMAYIMHKQGDPSQPDSIEEWLEQFDTFDIYTAMPEIITLWQLNNKTTSTQKKEVEQ